MGLNVLTQERLKFLLCFLEWGNTNDAISFWHWQIINNFLLDHKYVNKHSVIIENTLIDTDTTYSEHQRDTFNEVRLKYVEYLEKIKGCEQQR